jgi:hypothetical protein
MCLVIVTHRMVTRDPTPFVNIPTDPLVKCRSLKRGQNDTHARTHTHTGLRKHCFIAEIFRTEN